MYQEINAKQNANAKGNGTTDDTAALQAALATGRNVYLPPGTYLVSGQLTLATAGQTLRGDSAGASKLVTAINWTNAPLVALTANDCLLENVGLVETGASATNATKNGANNCGVSVTAARCRVEGVQSTGFGFGLIARDTGGTGAVDFLSVLNSRFSLAYSWGVEIDSVRNATLVHCVSHNNGLDGFKLQNEYSRTLDGMRFDHCTAYANGQRDIAAGGAENTNGNGFDLYHGGWRTVLDSCRAYSNYGSGLVVKGGGGGAIPLQGEFTATNCQFTNALTNNLGAGCHGVEIGVNYDTGNNLMQFLGCTMANNDGSGLACFNGFGAGFSNCNFTGNGRDGANTYKSRDIAFTGCTFFKNRGRGAAVGLANDATYSSRRVTFTACTFSGTYDPYLAASADPRAAAKAMLTVTADSGTDTWTSAGHGLVNGDVVRLRTISGTLPAGAAASTSYWVTGATTDTFQLQTYRGSVVLNITDNGTGTFYVTNDGQLALQAYSDSADVRVNACECSNFYNIDGTIVSACNRMSVTDSTFYKAERVALYVINGSANVSRCDFSEMDWTAGTGYGAVRCYLGGLTIRDCTFRQSSSTASTRYVQIDVGCTGYLFESLSGTNYPYEVIVTPGATPVKRRKYSVKQFGAVGNGTTDDTGAIQAAIDYCEANAIGQLEFEPGVYLISATLNLPSGNSGNVPFFVMDGNGCLVKTTTAGITIFARTVTALTDPQNGDYWSPIIKNFKLQGVSTAHGIVIHRTAYTLIENVQLVTFDKGIELVFALESKLSLINAKSCENSFRVISGDIPFSDGTPQTSASNVTILEQCRAQTYSVTAVAFYIEHSGNVMLKNCVAEGASADIALWLDNMTAGGYYGFRNVQIDGFWIELITSLNTCFKLESHLSNVTLKNVVFPYTDLGAIKVIDASGSTYSTFTLTETTSWGYLKQANAPWFTESSLSTFNRWVFDDLWEDFSSKANIDLRDPTWWVGGIVPVYLGRPASAVDQKTARKNKDLNSLNSAWTAYGVTPPTVAYGTFDGRDNVRKTTFTNTMTAGYSNCRASYAADTVPIVIGEVFRPRVDVKLSRALTGAEAVYIYYTGTQGTSLILIDASNSTAAAAGWTEFTIHDKPVVASGNVRLVCYLQGAVATDLDVEISNPRMETLAAEPVDTSIVKANMLQHNYSTFRAQDTTPSVLNRTLVQTANTSACNITGFDDGVDGQVINVLTIDGYTTFVHSSALQLDNGVNFAATTGGMLTLIKRSTTWYEQSRSVF